MCMSYITLAKNVDELKLFFVKNYIFDPSDPYMTFDPMMVMWHVAV